MHKILAAVALMAFATPSFAETKKADDSKKTEMSKNLHGVDHIKSYLILVSENEKTGERILTEVRHKGEVHKDHLDAHKKDQDDHVVTLGKWGSRFSSLGKHLSKHGDKYASAAKTGLSLGVLGANIATQAGAKTDPTAMAIANLVNGIAQGE